MCMWKLITFSRPPILLTGRVTTTKAPVSGRRARSGRGLEIVAAKGGPDDSEGQVEFIARFREKGVKKAHHELAEFKKEAGRWYFTDGKSAPQRPLVSAKVGRNDPCSCGSGKKYKKCCGN